MTLTPDQKRALYIGGGIAIVAILLYGLRGKSIAPAAVGVSPGLSFSNDPPGYTVFNIGSSQPPPSIVPQPRGLPPGLAGCGCDTGGDGCFTSDPLATGRGPVSLDQLLSVYAAANSGFADLVAKTQEAYTRPAPTLSEQASPGQFNPFFNQSLSAPQRFSAWYAAGAPTGLYY